MNPPLTAATTRPPPAVGEEMTMRTQQAIEHRPLRGSGMAPTTRIRTARPTATRLLIALATITVTLLTAPSAVASSNQTVSPRDNCGGFNGHVVVSDGSTPTLQLYGEVWDNTCPGSTSVWLAWQSPGYHNIQVRVAGEWSTAGVNYTTVPLQFRPGQIKVTVCSTYDGWHCGTPVSVADATGGTGSPSGGQGGGASRRPRSPWQATNGSGRETIPGTRLDLRGAASWALHNVFGSPGLFGPNDGFGDDCTDFVSRALAIGGGDPETVLVGRSTSNDHYWYFSTFRYGRWWSHSWSVAEDLAVHLNGLHSTWLRYWRDARPGDVIFADWTSSSFAHIDHVGIVTGMKGGEPLITQHTPNQRGVTLHYWQTHPPKLVHGRPNVHVWIAVPNPG
jgi:cell wall-associated NlpC family hydrolase